jgi:hypothetical protein
MHRSTLPMRLFAVAALAACAGIGTAQTLPPAPPPPPIPPQSEALPDVGVPPPFVGDPELEPQVTIKKKDGETVEEARVNGRLVWIKVTPNHGKPYFLIPDTVNGVYIRRDGYDSGLRVPLWELFSF